MTNEAYEKMIRDDFKDHVATLSKWSDHIGDAMTLEWAKPGANMYRVVYILRGGLLIAWGDCGEAIYSWGGVPGGLTPEWLAGLNLGYFAEKCEASDNYRPGERGKEWDRDLAKEVICEIMQEEVADDTVEFVDLDLTDAAWSPESACQFARDRGLSEERCWLSGWTISGTVRRHFYGLKMAAAQLAGKESTCCQ